MPFGFPDFASFWINPPFGCGVSSSIPAIFNASVFATAMCPAAWLMKIGWVVDALSKSSRVGWRCS